MNEEKLQKKAERKMGFVTIILWLLIYLGGSIALSSIFMNLGGAADEGTLRMLSAIIPTTIMLVILLVRYFKTLKEDFKRLTKNNAKYIFFLGIILVAGCQIIALILDHFRLVPANESAVSNMLGSQILLTLILTVILAPIVEELLFRKALSQVITNDIVFVIVSALVFGFFHDQSLACLAHIFMGVMLALIYLKTNRNIVAAMIVHSANNLFGMMLMLLLS